MGKQPPYFSESQWEFIAAIYAFGLPVSLELVGKASPLAPAEFINLQDRAIELGWIQKSKDNIYNISKELPKAVKEKLKTINSPEKIASLMDIIDFNTLTNPIDQAAIANLLHKNGLHQAAAKIESTLARYYISTGRYLQAMRYLDKSVSGLIPINKDEASTILYVENILKISNFTFALGTGFDNMPYLMKIIKEAINCAKQIGNPRLFAMAHLHLGRLQLFSELRSEALNSLSIGRKKIEEFDDEDSRYQASEFIGLYYYIQGNFYKAIEYFEMANHALGSGYKEIIDPCSIALLGYSAAYVGQLSLAIGSLECNWRMSIAKKNSTAACTIRSALGTVLLLVGKNREGYFYLQEAVNEAVKTKNSLALYFGRAGLALYHFLKNQYQESYALISLNLCKGIDSGKGGLSLLSSPWVLEMIHEAYRRGIKVKISGFNFQEELERIINAPNIHLKGVALRIKAQLATDRDKNTTRIQSILDDSENYLAESGDQVQLSKTRIEKIRIHIRHGELDSARELAYRTRIGLPSYAEDSFPDDLRYLLEGYNLAMERTYDTRPSLKLFLEMLDELFPDMQIDDILTRMVKITNRFFSSERGGLFWFEKKNSPYLRTSYNIIEKDITKAYFRSNLTVIQKSFRLHQPIVTQLDNLKNEFKGKQSILCIPFKIQDKVGGVLYHENSYLDGCFDLFERSLLERLSGHLTTFVKRLIAQREAYDNKKRLVFEYSPQNKRSSTSKFIFQSSTIAKLLAQADSVANSDASVLILGETGVGKGLLANRVHEMSSRCDKPLVIVDMTTIPENLVESELFGYEKGAFTGADRQKLGRFEIANGGSLFMDEIGEIGKNIQIKLLRVIQEKKFIRLGGTRALKSDFRLIAATNRNLSKEMTRENFRSDLLFRINTITLTIPPLRERKEDIIPLAEHFFAYFADKHKRTLPKLMKAEKTKLMAYHWPGNVRELMNMVERSILLSDGDRLETNLSLTSTSEHPNPFSRRPSLDELQKQYIEYVLTETRGQIGGPGGAVEILKLKRTTLNARIKKLGISIDSFR